MSARSISSTQQQAMDNASCEFNSNCCAVCGENERLLRCSRCRGINYCSKEHQKLDWKRHKKICSISSSENNQELKGTSTNKNQPKNKSKHLFSTQDKIDSTESQNDENQSYRSDIRHSLHTKQLGDGWVSPITSEGSSEDTLLGVRAELLNPLQNSRILENCANKKSSKISEQSHNDMKHYPELNLKQQQEDFSALHKTKHNLEEIDLFCRNVIRDMNRYGVCVVNKFFGKEKGLAVLDEVINLYSAGTFKDGQLVSDKAGASNLKTIRGDQVTWLDGKEKNCENIGMLISKVDAIIMRANKMDKDGKLGKYTIKGRTKAMVSCYPGSGSHYVKHVDNPNRDGRCITAIYYLNKDWDVQENGGLLRIFPEGWQDQVADIEPIFDRILFFWSDRRNPHEVQPAYKTRYAITLWYYDADERNEACQRYQRDIETNSQPENA